MGIDIYLKWKNMDKDAAKNQITGFSTTAGDRGYLREAYHGGPYATKILVREAFESDDGEAKIPAATLRMRLTHVTEPARGCSGGDQIAMMVPELFAKGILGKIFKDLDKDEPEEPVKIEGVHSGNVHTAPMTVEEAIRLRCRSLYPEDGEEYVEAVTKSFRDFVALAEQKEKETGETCTIIASY